MLGCVGNIKKQKNHPPACLCGDIQIAMSLWRYLLHLQKITYFLNEYMELDPGSFLKKLPVEDYRQTLWHM